MPVPTFVWSETNTVAAVTTDNIVQLVFAATDQNSNTTNLAVSSLLIVPQVGSVFSFEKYLRLRVTQVASNTLSAFGIYFAAFPPEDAGLATASVNTYYGTTSTYATPLNTTSLVATSLCATNIAQPGVAITTPANTIGAYSSYVVQQFKATAGALGGNTIWPNPWTLLAYVYN